MKKKTLKKLNLNSKIIAKIKTSKLISIKGGDSHATDSFIGCGAWTTLCC